MALFFFFENNRINVFIYFTIATIILTVGPDYLAPSLSIHKGVPVIKAPCGALSGARKTSRNGRSIYSYTGIPFAKPPIGDLRFVRPLPYNDGLPWDGIKDFKSNPSDCVQNYPFGGRTIFRGEEDCLNLNVYVPNTNDEFDGLPKKNLPVMFWIHGGGYVFGGGSDKLYGPEFLLDRDIILVSVYYRLGSLGSLNLGNDHAAGNQALWDQRLALKWVQENIEAFGGDREMVTIAGESAGAMYVNSHLASPDESEGLFSAAIIQSGAIMSPFNNLDITRPMTDFHKKYAEALGCTGEDPKSIVNCMNNISPKELIQQQKMFDECNLLVDNVMPSPNPWKPTFDADSSSHPFFPKDPREATANGETMDVPVFIGINKDEGLIATGELLRTPSGIEMLKENFDSCMVKNLFGHRLEDVTEKEMKVASDLVAFYGVQKEKFDFQNDFKKLTNLLTDASFAHGSDHQAKSIANNHNSPAFYYILEHIGSISGSDIFSETYYEIYWGMLWRYFGFHFTKGLGTAHFDDIFYLFKGNTVPINFLPKKEDEDTSKLMVDLWANFITYRHPTPKTKSNKFIGKSLENHTQSWKRVTETSLNYGRIANGKVTFDADEDFDKRLEMWRDIILKEKRRTNKWL